MGRGCEELPVVGIEPATFHSESAALTTCTTVSYTICVEKKTVLVYRASELSHKISLWEGGGGGLCKQASKVTEK